MTVKKYKNFVLQKAIINVEYAFKNKSFQR